jgi:tRNA dimethylallyltransferase
LDPNPEKILLICGPTCTGKTALGVELAERFGGEIISADSRQVYRFMDIGTAKPEADILRRARHHLLDVRNPDEYFSASDFRALAIDAIHDARGRHKLPIVVGGTGMYIKVLFSGIFPGAPASAKVRERLKSEAATAGTPALHERLRARDPEAASRIHQNDLIRIIRALEIHETTGKTLDEAWKGTAALSGFEPPLRICLDMERKRLYENIDKRVDTMMEKGFENEVRGLLKMGYGRDLNSMSGVGYRELSAYIAGEIGLDQAVSGTKMNTRRYAKRQLTWFRADKEASWYDPFSDTDKIISAAGKYLGV